MTKINKKIFTGIFAFAMTVILSACSVAGGENAGLGDNKSEGVFTEDMKIPYVGDNSAVSGIVGLLPALGTDVTQRFFSIGENLSLGLESNTLTLYYEPVNGSDELGEIDIQAYSSEISTNAILLFALIENLNAVSFTIRSTVTTDGQLDVDAYTNLDYRMRELAEEEYSIQIADLWEDGTLTVEEVSEIVNTR